MLNLISIPFGYLMRFFYMMTRNYALALIMFALIVKLIMLPLTIHQRKSAVTQARLRPKERAIRKRYEGRTDAAARIQMSTELQAMYKEENYSVAGGCLPILIQFPIIIALYNIVRMPLTYISHISKDVITAIETKALELVSAQQLQLSGVTAETKALSEIQLSTALKKCPELLELVPGNPLITDFSLWNMDLSAIPTFTALIVIFPILAGVFQWLSSFVLTKLMPQPAETGEKTPEVLAAERTMKNMNIVMPIITVFFAFSLPAVMSLYWVYQSILGAAFTYIVYKRMPLPTYTEEEYRLVEQELNKDYVPIPVARTASGARSLHRIDDEYDDDDSNTVNVTDFHEVDESAESKDKQTEKSTHRAESAPRVRYDKNGNPIRSLHYIDFDEDEQSSDENSEKEDTAITDIENQPADTVETTADTVSESTDGPAEVDATQDGNTDTKE